MSFFCRDLKSTFFVEKFLVNLKFLFDFCFKLFCLKVYFQNSFKVSIEMIVNALIVPKVHPIWKILQKSLRSKIFSKAANFIDST